MSLPAGARLGPYEILTPLGAGGMGEVYKARDTRLDRIVAVKVLPSRLGESPEALARLEREARTISGLNHPHICTLFDIGTEGETRFLVMEHLEGETLASRLERGALPVSEALALAVQIAAALDAAHRSGIVHRDLKPGNVMLTRTGAKLLDFGLAKGIGPSVPGRELTLAPTMTSPLTLEGALVGTFQYMSPEQLEGREADPRSDLFAFGCVLYEMVAGKRPFEGKTQASLAASILKDEPKPLSRIQPLVPASLDRVIRQCLVKDPDERWQSAGDLGRELRWISEGGAPSSVGVSAEATTAQGKGGRRWIVVAAALLLVAAAAGWMIALRRPEVAPPPEVRFSIPPPDGTTLSNSGEGTLAVSPDGRTLAFRARSLQGGAALWLRPMASLAARELPGTANAGSPFWSPDGRFLCFFADGKLKKVAVSGGAPQLVCEVDGTPVGGTWSPAGTILFAVTGSPLLKVSDAGGRPSPATRLDADRGETAHQRPQFLPDGRHFLYLGYAVASENRSIYLGDLASGRSVRLMASPFKAAYLDPGYLLYVRGAALVAQPLSLNPPGVSGKPVTVVDAIGVALVPGNASYSASFNGAIAYKSAAPATRTQLAWFDRAGRRLSTVGEPSADVSVSLSPDGTRAAVGRVSLTAAFSAGGEPPTNLWVIDLARSISTRLTLDPANSDENPTWSPDGRRIAFARHHRGQDADIRVMSAEGGEDDRILVASGTNAHPDDWSPDGRTLLFHVVDPNGSQSLMSVSLQGKREPEPFVVTRFDEGQGQFSPDGRFVAYTSDESGAMEVYVRPFPPAEKKWQISSQGGGDPRWRADGKEIFYLSSDGMLMSVAVKTSPGAPEAFQAGAPAPLFRASLRPTNFWYYGGIAQYAVSRDGQRFLVSTTLEERARNPVHILLNWRPPS